MTDFQLLFVRPSQKILETLEVIDRSQLQIALVVSESGKLEGVVTDGDIRRGILKKISLDSRVELIMNRAPSTALQGTPSKELLALMRNRKLKQIPVLDTDGRVVGLEILDDLIAPKTQESWVVLMAGGEGKRLRPLTENTPKPLIEIGSRPILSTLIESLADAGFKRIFLSVNYMADKIKSYFGDGEKFGVEISYLEEKESMGTIGSLRLLPFTPKHPLLIINGDILTKVNYGHLLAHHREQKAEATICARNYEIEVPYGVLETSSGLVTRVLEKPRQNHLISAGIYVLSPKAVSLIPRESPRFDMPELIDLAIQKEMRVSAFAIHEYWMDIGRHGDLERANADYGRHFSPKETKDSE
jgi:dTDP-glucose pyrophosphorylase